MEIDLILSIDRKRKRGPEFSDIEENVATWFKQCRDSNIRIGHPILNDKLFFYANLLGPHNSKLVTGGLNIKKKKKRLNIDFKIICGECAAVSDIVVYEWKINLIE